MKVLINAYACSPDMGSEPGMGWNWCVNLAKYCELYIITESEFRSRIESVVPTLEQGNNMHFFFNPVSENIRQMCWNQGDWRFYWFYKRWQQRTTDIARDICKKEKIDILHQLNMIGFREPGYLWQLSIEMGIPFIWGPVDAKESFPMAYSKGASLKTKIFLYLKNFITKCQLKYGKRVHKAASTASLVLSSSSNSVNSFKKYFHIDSLLMNETGTYPFCKSEGYSSKNTSFNIIWVGKFDYRKQLSMALEIISELKELNIKLHILGTGNESMKYKKKADILEIEDKIIWHGQVHHDDVNLLMRQSDLFLFTSIMEGTSTVIMEALQNGLPVICFDTCGMSAVVNDSVGYKVPLSNPTQSVRDFSERIKYLYNHREDLVIMSRNCFVRANELSWDNKTIKLIDYYKRIIDNNQNGIS